MAHLYQAGATMPPVLRVAQTAVTSSTSSTLTVFVSTTATITLTPYYTTSVFLITACGVMGGHTCWASIFRNNTNLFDPNYGQAGYERPSTDFHSTNMVVLDAPGTVSPITYEVRIRSLDANSVLWGFFCTHTLTVIEYGETI